MNFKQVFIIALATSLIFVMPLGFVNVNVSVWAEKCQDITGTEKWNSEGHSDHSPSEKAFFKDMDNQSFCEFAKDIDHMKKEGAVREDTKHDWNWFVKTIVYQSAGEETQDKLKHLYNLPDDNKKNLEAYEFLEAIYS